MDIIKVNIDDLIPAEYNPRIQLKPGDKKYEDLKNSIQKFGYIDLVIINKNFKIVGGHQRLPVLKELGYKVIDVVQIDITNEKELKALNIALNKIDGDWNFEKLGSLLNEIKIENEELFNFTGFDNTEFENIMKDFSNINNSGSSNNNNNNNGTDNHTDSYTEKIKAPLYEAKKDKAPEIEELMDTKKAAKLINEIKKSKIDKKTKDFLIFSAYRFINFNYENIAEFYCHSDKEIQQFMEKLALIIIDYDKAIEYGLAEFGKNIYEDEEINFEDIE